MVDRLKAVPEPRGRQYPELLYVCSITPEDTGSGSLVMYRHLEAARDQFRVTLVAPLASPISHWGILRRVATVLSRLGASTFAERLHNWINGRWADGWLVRHFTGRNNAVVVTIAHGDLPYAAARAARIAGLPMVVIFHDWWPDIPPLCSAARTKEDYRFRHLHSNSSASLPVCEGMRTELGPHPYTRTLYPLPSRGDLTDPLPCAATVWPFRVLYAGNLTDYGPMLESALQESLTVPEIRLEVSGGNPTWSPSFQHSMQTAGLWLGFLPRRDLDEWLRTANAFIIAMAFSPQDRRRMQTSFPSKLTELSRYGRPLVIWGPEDCSAVRWARDTQGAIYVSSPCPSALLKQLVLLASDTALQVELGKRARNAYETCFQPDLLQKVFEDSLIDALMSATTFSYTETGNRDST